MTELKEWELYKDKRYPMGFWYKERIREATKWMIEEKLKWTDADIKNKLSTYTFREYKLLDALRNYYGGSFYKIINDIYPDKFKPWEFKKAPNNFMTLENGIAATKWMIEEKLKWSDDDIRENLSQLTFKDNGLISMLSITFHGSPFTAINFTYPDKFKPWELRIAPQMFWTLETGITATKWMIEEKLKWSDKDVKESLTYNTFKINGLLTMLNIVFSGRVYDAINFTYPDKFKPWELQYTSRNFWTLETAIEATKWLINEKLRCEDNNIPLYQLTRNDFVSAGLGGMLRKFFSNNHWNAINYVYPKKYQEDFNVI